MQTMNSQHRNSSMAQASVAVDPLEQLTHQGGMHRFRTSAGLSGLSPAGAAGSCICQPLDSQQNLRATLGAKRMAACQTQASCSLSGEAATLKMGRPMPGRMNSQAMNDG